MYVRIYVYSRNFYLFRNEFNNPKFYSGRNKFYTVVRKYLLQFVAESFVFQFAIKGMKVYDIMNCKLACGFELLWSLVADIEVGKEADGD